MSHERKVSSADDDLDPAERMLKASGCLDSHYAVQACMVDHKDWRRCQDQVKLFKECIEKAKKKQNGVKSAL